MPTRRIEPDTRGRDFARRIVAEYRRNARMELTEPPPDGIAIAQADDTGNKVYLKPESLKTAFHVVGASGSGKTNFLKHLVRQLLERKRRLGYGFAIIDPHGELAEFTLDMLALFAGDLAEEVYYLDFRQDMILSINPLARWWREDDPKRRDYEYATADLWKEALTKAYGARNSMNQPSIATVLTHLGEALTCLGLAPVHASYFLNRGRRDRTILSALIKRLPQGDMRSFWEHYSAMRPSECDVYAQGPRNRLRPITGYEQFRFMFGQTTRSLDCLDLMNRGGIAIFNLSPKETMVSPDALHLVASLLVQQFRQAYPRRTENDSEHSPPFTLVLDEFGEYCSPEFARAFTAARKYNFEVVFAHQDLNQLVPEDGERQLLDTVLAIPTKAVFGGIYIDQAELLAKQIYLEMLNPDKIQFEPKTIAFWPINVKDITTSWGKSKGVSTGEGETDSKATASSSGLSHVLNPAAGFLGLSADELARTIDSSGLLNTAAESRNHFLASSEAWSEGAQEVWRTEYKPFFQPGAPMFEDLKVQVFRYAKAMSLRPQGHFVFYQRPGVPLFAHVSLEHQKTLKTDERSGFLNAVYRKPAYRGREAIRRELEETDRRLAEHDDDAPEVLS